MFQTVPFFLLSTQMACTGASTGEVTPQPATPAEVTPAEATPSVEPLLDTPAPTAVEASAYPEQVITLMREGRVEELAERIRYPLVRPFPLDRVREPAAFVERYDEIFDEAYREKIVNSEPSDWGGFGWRGRSYEGMWVAEDEDIIHTLNHESPAEEARRLALNEAIRGVLHPSLRDFTEPVLYMETTKFKIWVEAREDDTHRYAAWSRRKALSDEPDLVLEGSSSSHGSMRLVNYDFQSGDYTYTVDPRSMKSGMPGITVEQGGTELLEQEGRWVSMASVVADPAPGPLTFTLTGKETLQAYTAMPRGDEPTNVQDFLETNGLILLEHQLTTDPDPNPGNPYESRILTTRSYTIHHILRATH